MSDAYKKRVERLRRALRSGVLSRIYYDGAFHDGNCTCYDCLYGPVRDLREAAARARADEPEGEAGYRVRGRVRAGA